ncbi:MAG: single-stranded DNA-binding protein [Planctomycetota bacterium]|nr:MAG: single-stranded DNA-binding protein [Planctomycetota bacterium]
MASFNKVILLGNVTRDPELRYVSNGTPVTEIGLAVNNRRKGPNGEWVDETTFVDVTFWSRDAEIAGEYVTKGSPLMIEGRLKLDTWEKDGKKNSKLRVVGERLVLLGNRAGGPEGRPAGAEGAPRAKPSGAAPRGRGGPGGGGGNEYDQSSSYDEGSQESRHEGNQGGNQGGSQGSNQSGYGSHGGSEDDIPF